VVKVAGSIPDEVLFYLPNPSGRTRPWGLLSLEEEEEDEEDEEEEDEEEEEDKLYGRKRAWPN
jgi:hypothetical protein